MITADGDIYLGEWRNGRFRTPGCSWDICCTECAWHRICMRLASDRFEWDPWLESAELQQTLRKLKKENDRVRTKAQQLELEQLTLKRERDAQLQEEKTGLASAPASNRAATHVHTHDCAPVRRRARALARTDTRMLACSLACMHARTHARTHARALQ